MSSRRSGGQGYTWSRRLPARLAVDLFTQYVGVSGVSCCLFQKVHQDPAEVDRRLIAHFSANLVEARTGLHDIIDAPPGPAVCGDRGLHRVVRSDGVVRNLDVQTGKTTKNPERLRSRYVLHQPQEGRPTANKGSASGILIDALDLPDERLALVLEQRPHRVTLVAL
jgi:hypothetical protein